MKLHILFPTHTSFELRRVSASCELASCSRRRSGGVVLILLTPPVERVVSAFAST